MDYKTNLQKWLDFGKYDQNIKIVGGKIDVPDVEELIKQAAFYRKQSSKHAN